MSRSRRTLPAFAAAVSALCVPSLLAAQTLHGAGGTHNDRAVIPSPAASVPALRYGAGATSSGPKIGKLNPALLRRDAPPAVQDGSFDPNDPSLALAFNSTVNGVNLNGVGQLWTPIPNDPNGFYSVCTIQRIGPQTLLTAAHCVTDELNGSIFATEGAFARFLGPGSTETARVFYNFDVANIKVQSDWLGFDNPNTVISHDIAVLTMEDVLPGWVTSYGLYTGNPAGQETVNVGYGTFGTGVGPTGFDSRRRWGTNFVDLVDKGEIFGSGDLFADFDDGSLQWNSNCLALGLCDFGQSTEAGTAPGDSGGPLFINGQIAGITSFGTYWCADQFCTPYVADPSRPFNSYGALNAWAPVGDPTNLRFIQASTVPEPATVVLTGVGLFALAGFARRRRTA